MFIVSLATVYTHPFNFSIAFVFDVELREAVDFLVLLALFHVFMINEKQR